MRSILSISPTRVGVIGDGTVDVHLGDFLYGTIYFDYTVPTEETLTFEAKAVRSADGEVSCWVTPVAGEATLVGSGSGSVVVPQGLVFMIVPVYGWYDVRVEVKDSGSNVISTETFPNKINLVES